MLMDTQNARRRWGAQGKPTNGAWLRSTRHWYGLKTAEVADALGVCAGTIRNIEGGSITASERMVYKLARFYGVDYRTIRDENLTWTPPEHPLPPLDEPAPPAIPKPIPPHFQSAP